jgi:ribosomal protein L12E/L44/L45/RPP1/RPP2
MGTSKSYSASIKGQPQWGNLSAAVTTSCGAGTVSNANLANIISKYVNVIGGSSSAGRGGSKIAGKAGIRTAKNFGGFLGAFQASGGNIREALAQIGLTNLEGKSLDDVIKELIQYCSGPASTIDDVAAKTAAQKILEEIALNAETVEEFEVNLQTVLSSESLEDLLIKYFGYYIFEHLSIMFYEKLVVDKGKTDCDDLFRQIKDYISEKMRNMNKTNPINTLDWNSSDADRIIKNIQEDVLKVFEDYGS